MIATKSNESYSQNAPSKKVFWFCCSVQFYLSRLPHYEYCALYFPSHSRSYAYTNAYRPRLQPPTGRPPPDTIPMPFKVGADRLLKQVVVVVFDLFLFFGLLAAAAG